MRKRNFWCYGLGSTVLWVLFWGFQASAAEFDRETPVVRAVRIVGPAVVNISSAKPPVDRPNPFSGFRDHPFFDSFFKDFFEQIPQREYSRTSLGSGVIIDGKRGFILTNTHVVENMGAVTVVLQDEREFQAEVVGADPDSDLAVLRIQSDTPLPAVEMAENEDLMIGETVIAIGNPFGFSHTVTTGVISALNRSIRTEDMVYHDFIQTDASINPGNSGGPLLDINGKLIGINTAIYAKAQGIGFAIPIQKARKTVSDLIRYGEVIPVWTGLTVQELDGDLAAYLDDPKRLGNGNGKGSAKGVMVSDVEPDSPASAAGIKNGEILLSVGNQAVSAVDDFEQILKQHAAGDTVEMEIWRGGKSVRTAVRTAIYPESRGPALVERLLGITVADIAVAGRKGRPPIANTGVVITGVSPKHHLGRIGVKAGDVIHKIDDMPIKNPGEFYRAVIKYRQKPSLVILLQRAEQLYYLTVKI